MAKPFLVPLGGFPFDNERCFFCPSCLGPLRLPGRNGLSAQERKGVVGGVDWNRQKWIEMGNAGKHVFLFPESIAKGSSMRSPWTKFHRVITQSELHRAKLHRAKLPRAKSHRAKYTETSAQSQVTKLHRGCGNRGHAAIGADKPKAGNE